MEILVDVFLKAAYLACLPAIANVIAYMILTAGKKNYHPRAVNLIILGWYALAVLFAGIDTWLQFLFLQTQ